MNAWRSHHKHPIWGTTWGTIHCWGYTVPPHAHPNCPYSILLPPLGQADSGGSSGWGISPVRPFISTRGVAPPPSPCAKRRSDMRVLRTTHCATWLHTRCTIHGSSAALSYRLTTVHRDGRSHRCDPCERTLHACRDRSYLQRGYPEQHPGWTAVARATHQHGSWT